MHHPMADRVPKGKARVNLQKDVENPMKTPWVSLGK